MKSLVYLSVAVPALMVAAPALAGDDSPAQEPYGAEYAPTASYDDGAYNWDDRVYSQQDAQSGVYDGTWTGNYVDDEGQVYQGEWQGTYVDENGQAYEGSYRGTSVGEPRYDYDTSGAPTQPYGNNGDRGDATPTSAYPTYEHRDDGVGGAIIGGVAGGVAGNVIAGRGNRLAGTLIGGGLGAVAGAAIDRAEDNGRYDRDRYDRGRYDQRGYANGRGYARPPMRERHIARRGPAYAPQYDGNYGTPNSYGWQGHRYWYRASPGYYYQPQGYTGGTTTVVVVPGQTTSTTTTTVTEEQYVTTARGHPDKRIIRKGR